MDSVLNICNWIKLHAAGQESTDNSGAPEPKEKTPLDQLEEEMIIEVQALFYKYREKAARIQTPEPEGQSEHHKI